MAILLALLLGVVNSTYTPAVSACNGVTATFSVPWSYDSQAYLTVTSTTPGGVVTTLALTTDYTLNLISTSTTATLTLTNPAGTCPAGNTLKIFRSTPNTQPTNLNQQTQFLPQTVMGVADRQERQIQEIVSGNGSAVQLQQFTPGTAQTGNLSISGTGKFGVLDPSSQIAIPGGVLRPIGSKLSDVVSVKDSGAVGDCSAIDTIKLQSALTAAAGKTLYIVPGAGACYSIDAQLVVSTGTRIVGLGGATIKQTSQTTKIFSLSGVTDVVIEGLTLQGYGLGDKSSTSTNCWDATPGANPFSVSYCDARGVDIYNSQRITIRNNRMLSFRNTGVFIRQSSDVTVRDNYIVGTYPDSGTGATDFWPAHGTNVGIPPGNTLYAQFGIYVGTSWPNYPGNVFPYSGPPTDKNIYIFGNTIKSTAIGVNTSPTYANVTIDNNSISTLAQHGVYVYAGVRGQGQLSISNNVIDTPYLNGIKVQAYVSQYAAYPENISISNNRITGGVFGAWGIVVIYLDDTNPPQTNDGTRTGANFRAVKVSDNIIDRFDSGGITVQWADAAEVVHNTISNVLGNGIWANSVGGSISRNIISRSAREPILVNSGVAKITSVVANQIINAARPPPAWQASTSYTFGDYVSNGGNWYVPTAPGISASSVGPTGTGTAIVDGTVTWRYEFAAQIPIAYIQAAAGFLPPSWTASQWYGIGSVLANGGNYYLCTKDGISASSVGPAGTGTGIVDGGTKWNYLGASGATNLGEIVVSDNIVYQGPDDNPTNSITSAPASFVTISVLRNILPTAPAMSLTAPSRATDLTLVPANYYSNSTYSLLGNRVAADVGTDVIVGSSVTRTGGNLFDVQNNGVSSFTVDRNGLVKTISNQSMAGATPTIFTSTANGNLILQGNRNASDTNADVTVNAAAVRTAGAIASFRTNNSQVAAFDFAGKIIQAGVTFANLGTPVSGTMTYCSDCTIANPCASGGTGAFAKRLNGVWVCN